MPDTVTVEPLTPVTLPDAIARLARALRKLDAPPPPPPKLGRVPPSALPPPRAPPAAGAEAESTARPPPRPRRPSRRRERRTNVHDPDELAALTVMLRAAIVVLDFFGAASRSP